MQPMRWAERGVLLLGMGSTMACLLSCGAQPGGSRRVLRVDHARAPNSFCVLNPEGCPPPPEASAEPEAFDLSACLKACEAGGLRARKLLPGTSEALAAAALLVGG